MRDFCLVSASLSHLEILFGPVYMACALLGTMTLSIIPVPSSQDARFGCNAVKIIQEAQSAGVRKLACNGCWEGDWDKVSTLSQ